MRPSFVAVVLALAAAPALAQPSYPASDPRSVVAKAIALVDAHEAPGWDEPSFSVEMKPLVTDALIAAVAKGARIAKQENLDLYDGDFFTGAQEVEHATLFSATIAAGQGDAATIDASVGTSDDPKAAPKVGGEMRYWVKRVGGVWKIDDFRSLEDWAKSEPSVKTLFSNPTKYRTP